MPEELNPEQVLQARRRMAHELLDVLDDGDLPGSVIRWDGNEIWVHTTGQVEGWLRTWLEREQITAPGDSERIADLETERDELLDRIEEARGKHRRLTGHIKAASGYLRRRADLDANIPPEESTRLADRIITAITDPLCIVCGTAAVTVPASKQTFGQACRTCINAHNQHADGHRCALCHGEAPDAS